MPTYTFPGPIHSEIIVTTDERCFRLTVYGRERTYAWSDIHGAGLTWRERGNQNMPTDMDKVLPPGFGSMVSYGLTSQQLVFALRKPNGRLVTRVIMIPLVHEQREAFLDEFKRRLGSRFVEEELRWYPLLRRMGVPTRVYLLVPMLILTFFLAALILFGWWAIYFAAQELLENGLNVLNW